MKKVSIITVNYNQPLVTEAMLDSIARVSTYAPLEVIVVDNGSTPNHVPDWEKKYPGVTFIRSEENLGFAGGNNLGINQATGDYFFLANNDTEFTEGLIERLAATLDAHPDAGIVSPKIRYYDQPDTLQYAGFTQMNYFTARNSCIGQFEKDLGQHDHRTGETGFIHGAAMMVRREAIEKAGLMPENYFLYYEEMDWCERIKKAGYTVWLNMQALIYHKESVSVGAKSPLKEYFMNRNRILFVRRNCPTHARMAFWPYYLCCVVSRNVIGYVAKRQWHFIPVLLKAVLWNITNPVNSAKLGYTIKR
ncbi:MAG: glycosyltransferase family 2 protein [Bacteroidota bacterium]